jgi:7-cyano-7-deazaguanine synthase in queuosine biosynthesis
MVISLSSSISGSGEYAEALNEFIDYASSNNAEFVSSSDLVEMSRTGIHELSEELLAAKAAFAAQKAEEAQADTSSDCPECDDKNNGTSLGTEVVLEL